VSGLPDGFTARPISLQVNNGLLDGPDVDVAFDVALAAESTTAAGLDTTREQIRVLLSGPESVVEEHRLFFDRQGRAVGLLALESVPAAREVFADVYVVPELATSLTPIVVQWGVAAAQRVSAGESGWHVDAGCYADDAPYQEALTSNGFERVRRFWRMELSLAGYPADEPEPPRGVSRRPVRGEDDQRVVHGLRDRSFSEHFGSIEHPFEEWLRFHTETRDYTPERWWIASIDGIDVGFCIEDDSRADRGATYVRSLGVVPEARGRGVARWLLQCVAVDGVRAGRTGVVLSVDSENVTGATRLYESLGMHATQVIDVLRRPL
jgi:ribosomal protein S18 acetylase RimI-like enzyme